MTVQGGLRAIPTEDRAWLIAALGDAMIGGAPLLPLPPEGCDPAELDRLRSTPLPEGTAVVVRTSGSSGVPKSVALSAEALRASAEATHDALGGPGQWLVALPIQLISGLQMLVRSEVAGIPPLFIDGAFDAQNFVAEAENMTADRRYVSLVPVQLSRLLDLAAQDPRAADALRRFDAILVGGQAVPLELRSRSHDLGLNLRRSYGMTETAGGCVYDGVEIGGTQVRIRDGEIQLGGPTLALGYVGDPALTAERFIEESHDTGRPTRWYRTGDSGELLGGMLSVTGRIDRVIVSGGVNVSLDEVERVLQRESGWEDAVALGAAHPEWGERVALVRETREIEPDEAVSFESVRETLRDALGPAAVPAWVNETPRLPRLPGGKPDRQAITAWIARLRTTFREVSGGEAV